MKLRDGNGNDLSGGALSIIDPTNSGPGSMTYTVTTGASQAAGNLEIYFESKAMQLAFDNVSLSYSVVPEPSAIALLVSGLIGLAAYAWRRRR